MKKTLLIAAIALPAVAGWFWYKKSAQPAVKYSVGEAVLKEIAEFVDTTGVVAPLNRVEIQPSASGRIEKILVEEGDKIGMGQVLALMSSADRVAILDAARALGDEQYKYWEEAYKPIKVVSPLAGTIILKNVVEGQTVGQSTVLFAVSDKLILTANVDESEVGKVAKGQNAVVTLDAYPDNPVSGKVFQILDEGVNQSNVITYSVKIKPVVSPAFFKSQMTANIRIEVDKKRAALLIPAAALTTDRAGDTAVITELKEKGPVYKKIETGLDQGNMIEVTKGLKAGEKVLFQRRNYKAQQASGGVNPLMPARPNLRGAGRALR